MFGFAVLFLYLVKQVFTSSLRSLVVHQQQTRRVRISVAAVQLCKINLINFWYTAATSSEDFWSLSVWLKDIKRFCYVCRRDRLRIAYYIIKNIVRVRVRALLLFTYLHFIFNISFQIKQFIYPNLEFHPLFKFDLGHKYVLYWVKKVHSWACTYSFKITQKIRNKYTRSIRIYTCFV